MNHSKEVKTTGTVNLREMLKRADKPKEVAKKKPPTPLPKKKKKAKDGKT